MPQQKNSTIPYIIAVVIILMIIGVGVYLLFGRSGSTGTATNTTDQSGFTPYGRLPSSTGSSGNTNNGQQGQATSTSNGFQAPLPVLRLLSNTPVGGYGASTTASTTIVRWVDRGRGNILEAHENNSDVVTISNTVVPMIFNSAWNKNVTAFVGQSLTDNTANASTLYAELLARVLPKSATTTLNVGSTSPGSSFVAQTPFELKGKNMPANIITYSESPKKDKIFFITNESGYGVGYTTTFDGKSLTQIFTTPLTQLVADWPEENTITITTKASATSAGFLYFVNPKTGIWKKVLGPILGLTTKVSHDAKYVLASSAENDSVTTAIYAVATQKYTDAVIRTIADKCVWGNFNMYMLYCGVPAQPVSGTYPDDWYRGTLSFTDKIWQVNASTGEIHLVTSIVDQSDRVIDTFNLGLDQKDEYLFFMNKNDLSLWSLDLVANKQQ